MTYSGRGTGPRAASLKLDHATEHVQHARGQAVPQDGSQGGAYRKALANFFARTR